MRMALLEKSHHMNGPFEGVQELHGLVGELVIVIPAEIPAHVIVQRQDVHDNGRGYCKAQRHHHVEPHGQTPPPVPPNTPACLSFVDHHHLQRLDSRTRTDAKRNRAVPVTYRTTGRVSIVPRAKSLM